MAVNIDFWGPVVEGVDKVFETKFDDREQRQKVAEALMLWLTTKARKKPVPDLAERLKSMEGRVLKMVESMSVEIVDHKFVVKVVGSDEETLKMFRIGTSWFESNPDLMETILSGLFNT